MHSFRHLFLLFLLLFAGSSVAVAEDLPNANDFALIFREEPHSSLPLGAACGGPAKKTLTCRAFSLTLQNVGTHTVRLTWPMCRGPQIRISRQIAGVAGWVPLSGEASSTCPYAAVGDWANVRLKPGEKYTSSRRLATSNSAYDVFPPGLNALQATWFLGGCADSSKSGDCLSPLLEKSPGSAMPQVAYLTGIPVASAAIEAMAPPESTLAPPGLQVVLSLNSKSSPTLKGCEAASMSPDCLRLQVVLRNRSNRALLIWGQSCTGVGLVPQVRLQGKDWAALESTIWACSRNVPTLLKLPAHGDVVLQQSLQGIGSDVKPLMDQQKYDLRILFSPEGCVASPDASFCLGKVVPLQKMYSGPVTVDLAAEKL